MILDSHYYGLHAQPDSHMTAYSDTDAINMG